MHSFVSSCTFALLVHTVLLVIVIVIVIEPRQREWPLVVLP